MASTNLMYRAGNVHIYNYIYQNCIRLIFFDKKKEYPCSPPNYKKNIIFKSYSQNFHE